MKQHDRTQETWVVLAGAAKLDCAITQFQIYGHQQGEPATTKVYLSEIAGVFEECDLEKQGSFLRRGQKMNK